MLITWTGIISILRTSASHLCQELWLANLACGPAVTINPIMLEFIGHCNLGWPLFLPLSAKKT